MVARSRGVHGAGSSLFNTTQQINLVYILIMIQILGANL
jgi:hypothetical protein